MEKFNSYKAINIHRIIIINFRTYIKFEIKFLFKSIILCDLKYFIL